MSAPASLLNSQSDADSFFGKLGQSGSRDLEKDMRYEVARLITFLGSEFPLFCSPLVLAKWGFYQSDPDLVTCFSCKKSRGNWRENENPEMEHRKLDPNCDFLNGRPCGNVPFFVPGDARYQEINQLLHARFCPPETPGSAPAVRQSREPTLPPAAPPRPSFQVESEATAPAMLLVSASGTAESTDSHPNNVISSAAATFGDQPQPIAEQMFNYRSEQTRLDSFQNWPTTAQVSPEELAKAGFFYTGEGDRVQCPFCRGMLRNWDEDDLPMAEHSRHFPNCPFVRGANVGNIALPTPPRPAAPTRAVRQQITDAMLGIVTDRPRIPQYAIEATRLNSFVNWPQHKSQTPSQLAKAGFFYAGYGDNVKCFYCDGGLRNWERGDDPWEEHARWFPRCPYVRQVKGEVFIANIQQQQQNSSDSETDEREVPNIPNVPGAPRRVERREIIMRLDRPMIKTILDMGFTRPKVMRVLEKRLQETGDDFDTPDALLEALFNEPDLPDDNNVPRPPPSTSLPPPSETSPPEHTQPKADAVSVPVYTEAENGQDTEMRELGEEAAAEAAEAAAGPQSANDGDSQQLVEENRLLKEQRMCKICMDEDVSVVFLPCGHLVCCASCAPALNKCPICRTHIRGTVRTYMS